MSVLFGNNLDTQKTLRTLGEQNNSLSKSFERLSSGLRITETSDDAAGLALSQKLSSTSQVFSSAARNVNDGLSMLSIAESALDALNEVAIQQLELAAVASDINTNEDQRDILQAESDRLTDEHNRIISKATYNGQAIFGSDQTATTIQAGFGSSSIALSTAQVSSAGYLNFNTETSSETSYATASARYDAITVQQGATSAYQNRLSIAFDNLVSLRENNQIASDRITTADSATEVSNIAKIKIIQNTAIAALTHSNLEPGRALVLLDEND